MRKAIFPAVGALALAAIVVGTQLGQDAIASIDPIHFQSAAPVPQDVSRNGAARPQGPVFADAYGWQQGYDARAADCGSDCPAFLAREGRMEQAVSSPYAEIAPPVRAASAEAAVDEFGDAFEPASAPREGTLDRYLHYRVSEDQPDMPRPAPAEASAVPPAAAQDSEPAGL